MTRMMRTASQLWVGALLALTLTLTACNGASGDSSSLTPAVASSADSAASAPPGPVAFASAHYSVPQAAGSVTLLVTRPDSSSSATSVEYTTTDGTARAGIDYAAVHGTLRWAENDATPRYVTVQLQSAGATTATRSFQVALSAPNGAALVGSPGTAAVTITHAAASGAGALQLSSSTYSVSQTTRHRPHNTFRTPSATISVERMGGSSGAVSVAYATANGSASGGTYTPVSGVLNWADGDSSSKSFSVPISSQPISGTQTFSVALSDPTSGATLGSPASATVSVNGSGSAPPPPVGTLQLAASSYSVAQNAGSLTVSVERAGGSSGAASVAYATADGTATAGTQYTATSGTLQWADGDASAKSFTVAVSNATPFTGSKTFSVALSDPSTGAAISSPGAATVTIAGDGSVGSLQLSASTYSVGQGGGSLTVTVDRVGGSSGAAGITYATENGTAVGGTDYTSTTGTLQWADGDSGAQSFSIPISNATPFSGTKSFTIALTNPASGATLGSPSTAIASITGDAVAAVGSLQLSASGYAVGQAAGSVSVTVNRTGGSSGAISVSYATADGTAIAGTDYTATSGTLQWADGDASSQAISVPVSNATPFTGSKAFTIAVSGATGGASLASPDSATVTISGSGTNTPPPSVFWVYYNGVYNWGGDYSYEATPNYQDTSGDPLEGPYDIAVTINSPWGGFLPYAGGTVPLWNFNDVGYTYLTFAFKPTIANQKAQVYFVKVGDIPVGIDINIFSGEYGPAPQPGVWATYKIPLSELGVLNTSVYKFAIQDMTGTAGHVFYLDNIGFE